MALKKLCMFVEQMLYLLRLLFPPSVLHVTGSPLGLCLSLLVSQFLLLGVGVILPCTEGLALSVDQLFNLPVILVEPVLMFPC